MKKKIITSLVFLIIAINSIAVFNLRNNISVANETILSLEHEVETKSTEIAKLETVIDNQKEKMEVKKRAIEIAQQETDLLKIKLENRDREIKVLNTGSQVSRGGNYQQKMIVEATAYTPKCKGCSGITKSGTDVRSSIRHENGMGIIAVDPRVIPLGSIVEIDGKKFIADDVGGAIKGRKIDILVKTYNEAIEFGRKNVEITILKRGN